MIVEWSSVAGVYTLTEIRAIDQINNKKQTNFVALARKQTISTEQPPLVGEVTANF
jgi:hypothetical protein